MARDHRKLRVFHEAHELTLAIYKETRNFPREEWFGVREVPLQKSRIWWTSRPNWGMCLLRFIVHCNSNATASFRNWRS